MSQEYAENLHITTDLLVFGIPINWSAPSHLRTAAFSCNPSSEIIKERAVFVNSYRGEIQGGALNYGHAGAEWKKYF